MVLLTPVPMELDLLGFLSRRGKGAFRVYEPVLSCPPGPQRRAGRMTKRKDGGV